MADRGWLERNALIKSSLPLTLAFGLRAGLQATYFVVIARALGAEGYGAFAGSTALVAIAVPFSGLGLGNVLIRDVARAPESLAETWGRALVTIGVTGALLSVVGVGLSAALLPEVPVGLVVFVSVSDLLFARAVDAASQAFQALERPRENAILQWLPSAASRLLVSE